MVEHVSFNIAFFVFAVLGMAGSAQAAIKTAGYPYYTKSGTTSSDVNVIYSTDGVNYTAIPPAGRAVGNWGWADDGSAAQQYKKVNWENPAKTGTTYAVPSGKKSAVYFDYIPLTVSFNGNGGSGSMTAIKDLNYDSAISLPANVFAKTGYQFNGWKTNATSGVVFADMAQVNGSAFWNGKSYDSTLYAQWLPNTYIVRFNGNGATAGSMQDETFTYDKDQALIANAFAKNGFSFAGWATNATEGAVLYMDKASVNNLTAVNGGAVNLYARWAAGTHTVTFDGNGGGTPSPTTKSVTYGSTYGQLASCLRTGYSLDGWYTAASGGTKIETTTTVTITAAQTLYAHWTPVSYTITYNGLKQGVTHSNPQAYTIESDTIVFSAPSEAAGYKFSGWSPASLEKGSTGNKTVSAQYLTIAYKPDVKSPLTYNGYSQTCASPGTGVTASGNQAVEVGPHTATFTPIAGYCWDDGTTTPYVAAWEIVNAELANVNVSQTGSLAYTGEPQQPTVYTRATTKGSQTVTWKYSTSAGGYSQTMPSFTDAGIYTVYFEASAPYHNPAHGDFQVVIGRAKTATVGFSSTQLTFTGREQGPDVTFTHCMEAAGSVKRGTNVGTYKVKATPDDNYAWSDGGTGTRDFEWRIVEGSFTATVSAGEGGSGGSTFSYRTSQDPQARQITLPKRTGYELTQWTASGYVGDAPTVSKTTLTIPARTAGDFTLTPTWTPITYTISFDANGGGGTMGSKTLAYDEEYEVPECGFTKTGCEFQSWQVIIDNRTVTNYPAGTVVSNLTTVAGKDVTFKANWTGYYTIAFDRNEGDGEMADERVERDVGFQLPSNAFSRIGYDFATWTTNLSASVKPTDLIVDGATVTNLVAAGETCTLHALWNAHHYTVTFNANGGTGDDPADMRNCTYGEEVSLPTPSYGPPKNYATFIGWSTNKSDTAGVYTVSNLTAEADGVVTLYAVWYYDVGEWSRVLDCNNLKFENKDVNSLWRIVEEGALPGSDKCLSHQNEDALYGKVYAELNESGTLTYWWKGDGDGDEHIFWVCLTENESWSSIIARETSIDSRDIRETQPWTKSTVKITVPAGEKRYVWFAHDASILVSLDHVTWEPDGGSEPTPGDPVAVTAAGVEGNVFSLTIPTESGTDYGVWTNADLTIDSWGLMGKPQPGEGQPMEFKWTILPEFPQLFFRAHKVEYK